MSFVGLWEAKIQRSVMEGEAVGVIILVDVINTGSFLLPLTTWGSPRGLKGWLYADDGLRGADFHLVAGPTSCRYAPCDHKPANAADSTKQVSAIHGGG